MLVTTPLDYGMTVSQTISTPPVEQPDEWAFIDTIESIIPFSSENASSYQELETQQQAMEENQRLLESLEDQRRTEYVQALQSYYSLLPNFTDQRLIQQQMQWLMTSL